MITLRNGVVASDPINAGDEIMVSVPNLTDARRVTFGPMSFRPQITASGIIRIPQRGDAAIIAIDDQGPEWLAEWHRGDDISSPVDLSGVDARVDALEVSLGALEVAFGIALNGNRIVRGTVSSAGAVVKGTGFSSARTGLGRYTITFNTAFADDPSVVATVGQASSVVLLQVTAVTTATALIAVDFPSGSGAADRAFHFIAAGP